MDDRDLTRLLDEAAAAYEPVPSPGRLALALAPHRRGNRRHYIVLGIAAGLTILGAGAAALTGTETAIRTPADRFEVDVTVERLEPVPTPTTAPERPETDSSPRVVVVPVAERTSPEPIAEVDPEQLELADRVVLLLLHRPTETTAPAPTIEHEPAAGTTSPTPTEPEAAAPPAPPATTQPRHDPPPTTQPPHDPPPTTQPQHHDPPATTVPAPPTTTEPPHQDPPPATTTPVAFSARQYWGSCDSDPPYDEFEGHAPPGSSISVSSPHGSGGTVAGADGTWYVQVFVPDAPIGETFTFTVTSSAGGSASFSFVRTG